MRSRGFTLLEMTVVMTIIGLTFALAAPRFSSMRDGASVRAAVSDAGALFSLARQTAITRRTLIAVVVDTGAGILEVRARGQRVTRRTLRTAYGIVLGSNRDSTVYDPRGLGYGLSNMTLTVRRGSIVDTLTISRLGRVR